MIFVLKFDKYFTWYLKVTIDIGIRYKQYKHGEGGGGGGELCRFPYAIRIIWGLK